ncbi:hypothetical protein RhiirA4_449822 [Rhizophagus irregularis]|uniref:Uncharacterized protein n=2 Tax=Rhizophagus irregularis TaxID=588596 RepID=A0A2I1HQY5_9GLOM|nr:hypothetical protein RhiirA4_449822 [Rhizophagus irregularis]
MPPISELLNNYIIKTKEKLNQSNLKTYCKCCIDVLGEEEGKRICFPNKTDRIVQHLKKCTHFLAATTPEKRDEIFSLLKNNDKELENKRPSSHFSDTTSTFSNSSRKVIIRSSYGPLNNFIVRSLSKEDRKKFNTLLIRLTVSCGWALHWKAADISSERETHLEVMEKTEAMIGLIADLEKKSINVCAVVTDSVGAYAASRRKLRISNRKITFLPCFAHQLNLCIGEVFKESTDLKVSMNHAIKLATYFRNANNKFFIAKLRDQQKITYGKYYTLAVPGETRWNSYYEVCTSVLRIQQALQIFAINYKPSLNQTRRKTGETPTISREIFEIIDSTTFWTNINTIVEILYPYCKFLNILQQDKARLFQVIHSLVYLAQFWNNYEDTQLSAKILFRLEKRWNDWEQPLLLLSCLLHPEYRMRQFKDNVNINYTTFGRWLVYYYQAWSGKESTCILREFDDFRLEKYPFDNNTYKQFNGDIWRYWCYAKDSTDELGFVACRLFGICVNTASVERLWSCMGFLQSNRRNRLMSSKALNMSKLRADITWKYRVKSNSSIPTPLSIITDVKMNNDENSNENSNENSHESPNENPNENSNDLEESDNEEIDLSHLTDLEKEFGNYLQGWAEMLEEETLKFQNEEDEINEVNEITVSDVTHPAVDTNAKWDLNSLFKELELPF